MNVFQAINARRAVKSFDPNHQMPADIERQLLEAARLAPTSFNIQHWRFLLLKDEQQRKLVRAAAWDQSQITDASLVIVICGDIQAWQDQPEQYWRNFPEERQAFMVNMLKQFYHNQPQKQYDEVLRSIGIAAQTLMLSAQALGYESCPMVGFDADKLAELIKLPEQHKIGMIVAIGKGIRPAFPRGGELPYDKVVFENCF
ncbi:Putative NAD(P)H nitroreductase MhqN [Ephemeroptericola cinctiostellae]|uniref:NAD(P)H nitroreductase MhqN n=1 Tax=Ephemeroptericola cinctiostellae TaxID=2268024 RepID=A0A345DBC1_9BURK|nr:nitroreductase family protein [Ephemeroptericola cinctiostellae]AXF85659.1 Putative NAD(P)H nitroreductase MhqN [Ephemeroptericola cinctiostellae]